MTRGRVAVVLLSLACLSPLALARWSVASGQPGDSLSKNLSVMTEVLSLVRRMYVEETDSDELLSGALDGVTDALDPFATFVPASAVEPFLAAREVGDRLSGLRLARERGILFVASVAPSSPAQQAGLEVGDVVAEIGGESTRAMPFWVAQSAFGGPAGSVVEVRVLRRGQPEDLELQLGTFERADPTIREGEGAWILSLPGIDESSAGQVANLLRESGGTGALVVDLRGSYGGEPRAAYRIASLLAEGKLGELREGENGTVEYESETPAIWSGPLYVLVDVATQGAAEVLAAALHEAAGATLVGRSTFGHAGRERVLDLEGGAQLILTDAYYASPEGNLLDQSLGPDEVVGPDDDEDESTDPILERALELIDEAATDLERAA